MSLIDRFIGLRDRLSPLNEKFGIPQYQNTVTLEVDQTTITITPAPKLVAISRSMVGKYLDSNVEVMGDELVLEGVSRAYPQELLEGATWFVNGHQCKCLWVDPNDTLTFKVYLEPRRDR